MPLLAEKTSPSARLRLAMLIGLLAAIVFAGLASPYLGTQGPQYDELHQAVGAFTWVGAPVPHVFCLDARGVCVLTTTYSAALKTHLYGLWLRFAGRSFDLVEWRRLGIGLTALGVLVLISTLVGAVGARAGALVAALLATDMTLLLFSRFDFGPVALAFLLRAGMIALWLVEDLGRPSAQPRPLWTAAIAFLGGLATLEKLSSVALLAALIPLLFLRPERRTRRHLGCAALGLGVGALPLAAINLVWWWRAGEWISLRGASAAGAASIFEYLRGFLGLGAGRRAQWWTLDLLPLDGIEATEIVLTLSFGLFVAFQHARRRALQDVAAERGAAALGLAYVATGMALALLPRSTAAHHWILGTPFQYLAVALAADSLLRRRHARRALTLAYGILLVAWGAVRGVNLIRVERALLEGRASTAFHPDLNRLVRFAAERSDRAIFVASDWGVGTQLASATDGRGIVLEPFWNYRGVTAIEAAQRESGRAELYLVRLGDAQSALAVRWLIEAGIEERGLWLEEPLDDAWLAGSSVVVIRRYRWVGGGRGSRR